MKKPIKIIAQLDKIISTRDGGNKITFECGLESLEGVQQIQNLLAHGEISLCLMVYEFGDEPSE